MSGGLKERLGRFVTTRDRSNQETIQENHSPTVDRNLIEINRWRQLGFEYQQCAHGSCLVRDVSYQTEHQHGLYKIIDFLDVGCHLSRLAATSDVLKPENILFLDTETTGLGQGTGNVPFLIGIGWIQGHQFRVRQYMIRHPGEEFAMLGMLKSMIDNFTHLATFNGKSFDWPIIKNRYVLNRISPPSERIHLDLLFPSRSLWQTTLPSCRLGTLEEIKLGVIRNHDVPGSMAPALYFRYLTERDATVLEGVFCHNEMDIVTLLTLATYLGKLLNGQVNTHQLPPDELLRLGLWYERLGLYDNSTIVFKALKSKVTRQSINVLHQTALYFKRRGELIEAIRIWESITSHTQNIHFPLAEICVELAIIYEHRLKNPHLALQWSNEALKHAESFMSHYRRGQNNRQRIMIHELYRRKARLTKKIQKD